ncbi:MAG TPA: SRPBCC domain-containing protein [Solirubrobacteraceae bacterium]|nr:SRPBCC domain-containing protein [Solirubrobacteraceae bacterium]
MPIHFEATYDATPQEVFELLTSGEQFKAMTGMPAEITDRPGEAFSLFGGRIEGRQVELLPGERIVQAWRFGSEHDSPWDPGLYSILRFGLSPDGSGTRLTIDHDGIPEEWLEHLEAGYPQFYLEPIAGYFAGRVAS